MFETHQVSALHAQQGQSLAVIAIAFVAVLAFVGLAVDGSNAYAKRRQMQNAADAAAIAGARDLKNGSSESAIYSRINSYSVTRNGATSFVAYYYSNGSITGNRITGSGNTPNGMTGVCVTTTSSFSTFFLGVIGLRNLQVGAQACSATVGGACPGGEYVVWTNSTSCTKTLNWTGGEGVITGTIHSNNDIYSSSDKNTINGIAEYVSSFDGKLFTFNPSVNNPVQVTANTTYPVNYTVTDYAPGGRAAVIAAAAGKYFTHSGGYNGPWPDGLHYLLGSGAAHISSLTSGDHSLTIVADGGTLTWSTGLPDEDSVSAYIDGLLLYSNSGSGSCTSGTPAINYSASGNTFRGILYAPGGYLKISGSSNNVARGSLIADSIRVSSSKLQIQNDPTLCGAGAATIKLVSP